MPPIQFPANLSLRNTRNASARSAEAAFLMSHLSLWQPYFSFRQRRKTNRGNIMGEQFALITGASDFHWQKNWQVAVMTWQFHHPESACQALQRNYAR